MNKIPLRTDGEGPGSINASEMPVIGYRKKQVGCFWILMLIMGLMALAGAVMNRGNNLIQAILLICWGLSTVYVRIEDRGEYLELAWGPCRWCLCGMGKEKVRYSDIRDYGKTKTCFYGFGLPHCASVKLFNTCSCCCGGANAICCKHETIRLTINERAQGEGAKDDADCCCESCCLSCLCGENGEWIGKGCCFQPICNPCNANCCIMNTIFVSTNDADGLIHLLNQKCGKNDGHFVTV